MDLSLKGRVEKLEVDNTVLSEKVIGHKKPKRILRFPKRYQSRRKYRKGLIPVIWLGSNHLLSFKWGEIRGGVIKIGDYEYKAKEEGAIYYFKRKPVILAFEWRLVLVGGRADVVRSRLLGGEFDEAWAKEQGLSADAQQTIIRAIMDAEIESESGKKKKGKLPIAFIILLAGIAIFAIGKVAGFF